MGNRKSTGALRREACPLGYADLDEKQKEGFDRIVAALNEAVELLEPASAKRKPLARSWNPWKPKTDKRSNLLFLSGERGTGKTTLMLSMFGHFVDPEAFDAQKDSGEPIVSSNLARRTLWLAPIDMEPLPKPTNLFAAILARIEHALDQQIESPDDTEARASSARFPGMFEDAGTQRAYRDCLKKLRTLQRDASTAWDGNLSTRAGQLDTDQYFHEVVRAERARVDMTHLLDDVLDYLAEHAPWCGDLTNPLFVLPIDDIDLNPAQAVDLLNLLRSVSSKRLFTLILGDIELMEQVLQYKIAGTLNELQPNIQAGDGLLHDARNGAAEGIRKLIPPGQRIHLTRLAIAEAFEFKLPGDAAGPKLGDRLGHKLLCLHPVGHIAESDPGQADRGDGESRAVGLDKLEVPLIALLANSVLRRGKLEPDGDLPNKATRYLGLRILSATPRFLSDLSLTLQAT